MKYPTYEQWFSDLSKEQQQKTRELFDLFQMNGCSQPELWVRSEISENFAQLARYLILTKIWQRHIDPWKADPEAWLNDFSNDRLKPRLPVFDEAFSAVKRLREAGISVSDLASVARLVAYSTAFGVINLIDEGEDHDAEGDVPGWSVRELDADGDPTGREIAGLH